MAMETIDYAATLADAEAKKAALEAYIASLKNAMATGALGRPGENTSGSPSQMSLTSMSPGMELPVGALLNKSIPEAINLYLSTIKKKVKHQKLAEALKEGGVESTSSNFEQVVYAALQRMKANGDVLKFTDGWAYAANYPDHIRKAVSQETKPSGKKPKKAAKRKVKKEPSGKASVVVPITGGLHQRIEAILKENTDKSFPLSEIATQLEARIQTVAMALAKMVGNDKARKLANGEYQWPQKTQKAG